MLFRSWHTLQWVMFQMGGIGPMFGQLGFFHKFAGKDYEDKRPRDRYVAAVPAPDGALELELRQDKPASLELTLPIGRFRMRCVPQAPLDITVSGAGITTDRDLVTVAGSPSARALLVATPQKGAKLPIRVRSVALQRLDK